MISGSNAASELIAPHFQFQTSAQSNKAKAIQIECIWYMLDLRGGDSFELQQYYLHVKGMALKQRKILREKLAKEKKVGQQQERTDAETLAGSYKGKTPLPSSQLPRAICFPPWYPAKESKYLEWQHQPIFGT
jgi:hypothetical protein